MMKISVVVLDILVLWFKLIETRLQLLTFSLFNVGQMFSKIPVTRHRLSGFVLSICLWLLVKTQPSPSLSVGTEPMTLGSPTSPKPTSGAQFLPGFLMGDLPAPATPQPRPFSLSILESTGSPGSCQEDTPTCRSADCCSFCGLLKCPVFHFRMWRFCPSARCSHPQRQKWSPPCPEYPRWPGHCRNAPQCSQTG